MKLIIGHSNMDPDCIASMTVARYLYPDHLPVLSRHLHPVVKNIVNLYEKELSFLRIEDIREKEIESLLIVDTRKADRVKEFFEAMGKLPPAIIVVDHHDNDECDIEGAELISHNFGSNVTFLVDRCIKEDINISATDATIAIAGIYADTGYFRHEETCREDFLASAYLLQKGASVSIIDKILRPIQNDSQIDVFHEMVEKMVYQEINGHFLIISYLVLDEQVGGLAAVVEKLTEVEHPDALIALFSFNDSGNVLIIGRSTKKSLHVNEIMEEFGGGGHTQAASALVKKRKGRDVLQEVLLTIKKRLHHAVTAEKIMTPAPSVLTSEMKLIEASKFLEKVNHSGAPVVDSEENICGFISLKDIMKARKGNNMKAPVRAYMKKKYISCLPETTFREVEQVLQKNNVGHLPVVKDGELMGIITRTDVLNFLKKL